MVDQTEFQRTNLPHADERLLPRVGKDTPHARPSAPGPWLPRPIDDAPRMQTGMSGESRPLPQSSPLYDIDLSVDSSEAHEPTLGERASEAISTAKEVLGRGVEAAENAREVASKYEAPLRRTSLELFTKANPRVALALSFGAGVMVAKALRRLT